MNPHAREYLVRLHETEGVGWTTIRRLAERLGGIGRLGPTDVAELRALGFSDRESRLVAGALSVDIGKRGRPPVRLDGVRTVTVFDREYPELLRHIARPPWVLYVRGDPAVLAAPSVAVVGTRKPTAYGRRMAIE